MAESLRSACLQVVRATTAAEARALVGQARPDLVVLDLMLPDEDGLVACCWIRDLTPAPILVCSDAARKYDPFLALRLGANDFIAKPLDSHSFAARVEVLLRRPAFPAPAAERPDGAIRLGHLVIDHAAHEVTLGDAPVQLTPTEYRLLSVLASRPDQVVGRETLADLVWGVREVGAGRTIDVHIGRLRLKLARGPLPAPDIVAVRGFGYKLIQSQPQRTFPTAV
jgi:DNA-binding response OmpR family regulator